MTCETRHGLYLAKLVVHDHYDHLVLKQSGNFFSPRRNEVSDSEHSQHEARRMTYKQHTVKHGR